MSNSRLQIVHYPDPVLRKRAAPVERITPEILSFISEMTEVMYEEDGVGLAAPQVGISLRIIVVDVDGELFELINPQILASAGSIVMPEGCLSLPDLRGTVDRPERVTVRAINRQGKKVTLSGDGMWARAMQHEIDHLDGVLFTDRVDPDSLFWLTSERNEQGEYLQRKTTLDEALRMLERQAAARV